VNAQQVQYQPLVKMVEAGVDWLTMTTTEEARYEEWKQAFSFVAAEEQMRGHKWDEANWFGYHGEACGHAFIGRRRDGAMAKLTSAAAEQYGHLFSPDAVHVTRIDLQITAQFGVADPTLLQNLYKRCLMPRPTNGRPVKYSLLQNSEGGSTLYVGSRQSMRYGRVYDKGVEDKQAAPGTLWRYELEVKDQLADQAVAMLYGSAQPDRQIAGILGDFFKERNVPVPWVVPPLEERFIIPRVTHEDAQSLKWLRGPVGSVVARLWHTVGPEQTLRALLDKTYDESSDNDIIGLIAANVPS